jgi:hypothetical protein
MQIIINNNFTKIKAGIYVSLIHINACFHIYHYHSTNKNPVSPHNSNTGLISQIFSVGSITNSYISKSLLIPGLHLIQTPKITIFCSLTTPHPPINFSSQNPLFSLPASNFVISVSDAFWEVAYLDLC